MCGRHAEPRRRAHKPLDLVPVWDGDGLQSVLDPFLVFGGFLAFFFLRILPYDITMNMEISAVVDV